MMKYLFFFFITCSVLAQNTNTPTPTFTKTATNTPTNTPTKTPTKTMTNTATVTPTVTYNWVYQNNIWRNGSTGQIYYGYPPGVRTFTPTPTPTNTPTITNTPVITNTPTITPTPFGNVSVILNGKSLAAGTSAPSTVSGSTCTVTHTSHGYAQNDIVVMSGGTSAGSIGDFNQLHVITSVATNTYTFTTTASTGSITGSPVEIAWFDGTRSKNPTLINDIDRASAGTFTYKLLNTQSNLYYGYYITGSYSSDGLVTAVKSQSTTQFLGNMYQVNTSSGAAIDPQVTWIIMLWGVI